MRMKKRELGVVFLIQLFFLTVVCISIVNAEVIYSNDFNDDPVGPYTADNIRRDWNNPGWIRGPDLGRTFIIEGAEAYEGRTLKIKYPEGSVSSGSQWWMPLPGSYEELYYSFRIRFDDNPWFNFNREGKIPGLAGGAGNTGGSAPTGYDGWSARMMWVGGKVDQYVYHPGQPSQWGHNFYWNYGGVQRYFNPGTWHHIEVRIVMNDPSQENGIIEGWFDGEKALDVRGISFRYTDSFAIDLFQFSTFFGGQGESRAQKDEYAYFDNFIISTEPIGAQLIPPFPPSDLRIVK